MYQSFTFDLFIHLWAVIWNNCVFKEFTILNLQRNLIIWNIVYAKARCNINNWGIDGAPRRGGVWVTGPYFNMTCYKNERTLLFNLMPQGKSRKIHDSSMFVHSYSPNSIIAWSVSWNSLSASLKMIWEKKYDVTQFSEIKPIWHRVAY